MQYHSTAWDVKYAVPPCLPCGSFLQNLGASHSDGNGVAGPVAAPRVVFGWFLPDRFQHPGKACLPFDGPLCLFPEWEPGVPQLTLPVIAFSVFCFLYYNLFWPVCKGEFYLISPFFIL